jgi:2-haloacid dehalogenase
MKIKNIIFDFGGVLVDWNPRYLYKDLFEDKSQMEYFLVNVCNESWNQQQDAGRSIAEGNAILQKQFPEYKEMIQLFYEKHDVMLKSEIAENVNLLYRLKEKYRVFGLTNWSGETFPIALKKFPFFKEFEGIVVSGDEKIIKPDKELFYILLDRYKLKAMDSVFIDDNIKNIESAKDIGFHTIHFSNGVNLADEFNKMNVL